VGRGRGCRCSDMAVNLSARKLVETDRLLDEVAGTIRETGMDPRWTELEGVIESVDAARSAAGGEAAAQSQDDGRAPHDRTTRNRLLSLAYLKRLPID